MPTIFAKLFGSDGGIRCFGVGFSFIGAAMLVDIVVDNLVLKDCNGVPNCHPGLDIICYIYGGFACCSFLILMLFFSETKVKI